MWQCRGGWVGGLADSPNSMEGRIEAEGAAPIGTSCLPSLSPKPAKHSLEAPGSLSPRSPWAPTQDGAAEGVGRKCFAEKGLFYCNYLESESQRETGRGGSGIKWKHVWSWKSFWKKKQKHEFLPVSRPGQDSEGPQPQSHCPPSLLLSFPHLAAAGPSTRGERAGRDSLGHWLVSGGGETTLQSAEAWGALDGA